jgi:DDE family transposase
LRGLVRCIRRHWPRTQITIRGDSHYGRREAMDWCEKNGIDYVFGLPPNAILAAQIFAKTDEMPVRRAIGNLDVVRDYTETLYAAKSWSSSASRCGADQSDPEGSRYLLHRHQHHAPSCPVALRLHLLCPSAG